MCVCVRACVDGWMDVCMYIYIHACAHIHIIYIYMNFILKLGDLFGRIYTGNTFDLGRQGYLSGFDVKFTLYFKLVYVVKRLCKIQGIFCHLILWAKFISCSLYKVRLHLPMHLKFRNCYKHTAVHKTLCACLGKSQNVKNLSCICAWPLNV